MPACLPRAELSARAAISPATGTTARSRHRPARGALHRIVIVGGGAGGLELATRLGDTLGKRGRPRSR